MESIYDPRWLDEFPHNILSLDFYEGAEDIRNESSHINEYIRSGQIDILDLNLLNNSTLSDQDAAVDRTLPDMLITTDEINQKFTNVPLDVSDDFLNRSVTYESIETDESVIIYETQEKLKLQLQMDPFLPQFNDEQNMEDNCAITNNMDSLQPICSQSIEEIYLTNETHVEDINEMPPNILLITAEADEFFKNDQSPHITFITQKKNINARDNRDIKTQNKENRSIQKSYKKNKNKKLIEKIIENGYIRMGPVKRPRDRKIPKESRRENTFEYFIRPNRELGELVKVNKIKFRNFHNISESVVIKLQETLKRNGKKL